MKWRLDGYYIVHFRLECLKDCVKLPSTSTALVHNELYLCLKWSERFKPEVKHNWIIRRRNSISLLVDKDRAIDESLVRSIENIDLKAESVFFSDDVEAWQVDAQCIFIWSPSTGSKDKVDSCGGTLSDSTQWVLPDELLTHAHNDDSLAFRHSLWRE